MKESERIDEIISHIIAKIENNKDKFEGIGISDGAGSLSMFYFICSKYYKDENYLQKGAEHLSEAFERLNNGYLSRKIFRELVELGKFIELLEKELNYPIDTNEALEDIDDILQQQMEEALKAGNFDPVTGALSYGYYFISRLESNKNSAEKLAYLLKELYTLPKTNENGMFWRSKLKDDEAIYLGITHGSSAILNFLSICHYKGISIDKQTILETARYIKTKQLQDNPILFPVIVDEAEKKDIYPNSWCYGDAGTLYGLLKSAILLEDVPMLQITLNQLLEVGQRPYAPPYFQAGPSLLYGTAGMAMAFHKIYEETEDPVFMKVYQNKIKDIIALYDPEAEFLGYQGYWNQAAAVTNYSFDQGMIGIALSLMTVKEPSIYKSIYPFYYLY